jgi:F-box protein 11
MKRQKPKPAAFMSYAHSDDKHGHLTQFRERLSDEVRVQIGEEFLIFQDRKDLQWGENWKERIKESIDEVTFLIPIITPSFFKSPACRRELQRFLEREEKLGRKDIVLPIYYVDCPLLNDKEEWTGDELAQVIATRQRADCADWRKLRFKPFDSQEVREALAELGVQIRDALERVHTSEKKVALEQDADATRRPAAKTPTRIVDQMHRGGHLTITEAIEVANPGDRILVRPGTYHEGLVIEKPLEIIGDDDVVVQVVGKNVLLFKTTMGRVANLTLRQMGGGNWYGVDIAQGRLELEDCDITSQSLSCVTIHGGADPRLRRNHIHASQRGNGVHVWDDGQGVLEDNEIFGNALAGVAIKEGGNPTLRGNWIHDGKQCGVLVWNNGQGVLEDNEIFGNTHSGVEIREGCNPTLRGNRINKNGYEAVWVHDEGGGTIEDNDLSDNAMGAWDISDDSEPNLRRARNKE